jgi:YidC/Oxa1 family membrane protein insertase
VNPYALLDPAVTAAHHLLVGLAALLHPLPWGTSVAAALVLVTIGVRIALLPLAFAARRSALARARLAPELARLNQRYRKDRQRLTAETMAAYRRAGVRPLAGIGPALAQAPVLATLYRLITLPVVAGAPNLVLSAHLFSAPMAAHWWAVLATFGVLSPQACVLGVLAAGLAVVAWAGGRVLPRTAERAATRDAGGTRAAGTATEQPRLLRGLPYITLAFAAASPVAVGLYLLTSASWTLVERALLTHLIGRV